MNLWLRLIREAHRRSLWQVLAIYLAASYAVYQVVLNLRDGVGLPAWVPGATVVVLLIGLPIVLATAFVQEGGPSRDGAEEDQHRGESTADVVIGTTSAVPTPSVPTPGVLPPGVPLPGVPAPDVPAPAGPAPGVPGPAVRRLSRLLTWRHAMVSGVFAFAALGAGTGGYMAMRELGIGPVGTLVARGVLKKRDPILLAAFQSPTGDTLLAAVVRQALRVGLEGSKTVTLVDPARVEQVLQRMRLAPTTLVGPRLAREIAEREGFKAYLAGEVGRAGGGYLITARLVNPDSDRTLETFRETAPDSTKLLAAVDRLSAHIQERVGEPLKSIQAQPPLEQVTTSSLEALRDYTLARQEVLDRGDWEGSIALFQEAIRHDTAFAMAYRWLSAAFDQRGRRAEALEAAQKAVRYSDRLDDRERGHAEGRLYALTARYEEERRTYQALLDVHPDDGAALNNLAFLYLQRGELAKAEQLLHRAVATGASFGLVYLNLMVVQLTEGKVQEAQRSLEMLRGEPRDSAWALRAAVIFDFDRGDYAAYYEEGKQLPRNDARFTGALAAMAQGRPAEAARTWTERATTLEQRERPSRALRIRLQAASVEAIVRQDTPAAQHDIDAALRTDSFDVGPAGDRPYLHLALTQVMAGRPAQAAALLRQYDTTVVGDLRRGAHPVESYIRGLIAMREGRPDTASVLIRNAQRELSCDACFGADLGQAQELLGRPDSAIAAYQRFVNDLPYVYVHAAPDFVTVAEQLPAVQERLAELYDARGDTAQAVKHYAAFTEMWKDAEPDLQPRVAAARRRLQALLAGKG